MESLQHAFTGKIINFRVVNVTLLHIWLHHPTLLLISFPAMHFILVFLDAESSHSRSTLCTVMESLFCKHLCTCVCVFVFLKVVC